MPMRWTVRPGGCHADKGQVEGKSFFVDERALERARKDLGAKTDAEVVRLSVERIAEMEAFWQFMKSSRRTLSPGSIEVP